MKEIVLLVLILICVGAVPENLQAQLKWPGNAKAAVCLTYDDGLDCHLDVVVPQLDAVGFKGTFFCTGRSQSLYKRIDEWRQITRNGHELGNHSLFHPCDGERLDWVKPEFDLNQYTLTRLLVELQVANTLLKAIDGKEERTFAYTCNDYRAGGEDFTGMIPSLFLAARGGGSMPETMEGYNLYRAPGWNGEDSKAEEMIAFVETAKRKGTVAIFTFHSVGGGYLNVEAGEHRKLLEYLNVHRDEYFIGTFMEVMEYIRGER